MAILNRANLFTRYYVSVFFIDNNFSFPRYDFVLYVYYSSCSWETHPLWVGIVMAVMTWHGSPRLHEWFKSGENNIKNGLKMD